MLRRDFLGRMVLGGGLLVLSPQSVFAKPFSPSDGKADWIYKGGLIYTANLRIQPQRQLLSEVIILSMLAVLRKLALGMVPRPRLLI